MFRIESWCGFPRMVNHHFLLRCQVAVFICFFSLCKYIDICRYFDLILWSIRSGFFGQSGPGHAAVLRGSAGDARNLAEPGLKKQMTDMFGLFKLRFYTNICLTLHVMFWWTLRLMIHTAYTACVQQPTTFHIIPQPSLLRHLTTAQTSRCRLEVHNPGGFNSYVDWLIHFSSLTFSFI